MKGDGEISKSFLMLSDEDDLNRFGRAFIGTLRDSAMAQDLKKVFLEKGIFTIRVTILGHNICLLEDLVFGEVEILIEEHRE